MLYHKPVLISQMLYYLNPEPNKVYVDTTFGGGGHTRAILKIEPSCKVIAIDWDKNAIEINGPPLKEEFPGRLELIWGNFGHLTELLKSRKIGRVAGILSDFGTSHFQIFQSAGFSFNVDTPLDMRMSPSFSKITAFDIINKASEAELVKIFIDYGQEYNARKIAKYIVQERKIKHFKTTKELASLIESIVPRKYKKGTTGHAPRLGIHPATKIFQALRIVVNDELNNIRSLLKQSLDVLQDNGRFVCISFHSLEDRIVKEFFKENSDELEILTKRVIIATEEEIKENPASRSAKLRAALRKSRCK